MIPPTSTSSPKRAGRNPIAVVCLAILAIALAGTGELPAQERTTGMIEGIVGDDEGKTIVGAAVTVSGPQGVRTDITAKNGSFVFRDLAPGNYSVKAEASGHATVTQTDVKVVLGKRTQVPFALAPGLTEQVTVTSEAPLVDMKSTVVGTTVSIDDFVDYVPLDRQFSAMINLAPSVVSGLGTGQSNYAISGSSGFENSYHIDGVNITNSGYGAFGTYNWVYKSLSPGVTSDFIDQVEIKTGGIEAEYGQATGGVVNAIVRSGTNTFAGQVSAFASPESFEAPRKLRNLYPDAVSVLETSRIDVGANFGGPLLTNKLFWFLAYNPVQTDTTYIRTVSDDSVLYDDDGELRDPDQPTGGRTETNTRVNQNYAAKLSWFAHPNHRIELTAFGDPSKGDFGAQRPNSLRRTGEEGFSDLDYGGNNYSLKYSAALTRNLFLDAMWGRHKNELLEDALPLYFVWDFTALGIGLPTGGLGDIYDNEEQVDQIALKLTAALGNHEIKVGYQFDDTDYAEAGRWTGPTWTSRLPIATYDATGEPVWTGEYFLFESTDGAFVGKDFDSSSPSGLQYLTQRSNFNPAFTRTTNEEQNFFVQDTWSVSPRVTLRLGVRWTEGYVAGGSPFELPFTVVRRSFGAGGSPTKMVDLSSPTLYVPTSVTFPSEWAPRVGLTWDVKGDGVHKLYANYARYVQRMTQDLAIRAFSFGVNIQQSWADEDLTLPYDYGVCPLDDGAGGFVPTACQTVVGGLPEESETSVVWPGTELPKTDEMLVGYSFEIGSTTGIDLRYVHREIDTVIEDFSYVPVESTTNGVWGYGNVFLGPGAFPFDPFPDYPGDFFGGYVLANPSKNSQWAAVQQADTTGSGEIASLWIDGTIPDFPEPERNYDAIELVFNRRMSDGWLMYAAYRYAKLSGNYEGLFRNDNLQDDPNITSLYDFPDTPLMRGQFLSGRLNTDAEHKLSVYGTYQLPFGLNLGGALNMVSGVPRFLLLTHPNDIYYIAGVGEVPAVDPVYASWVELDGLATNPDGSLFLADPDNMVLALARGLGIPLSEMSDGTLDADGELVFTDYTPGPTDVIIRHPLWFIRSDEVFSYSNTPARRDCCGRTAAMVGLDLHVSYDLRLGWRDSTVSLMLDAFNIFNSQEGWYFDDVVELERAEPNPNRGRTLEYQNPRVIRLGLRWNF